MAVHGADVVLDWVRFSEHWPGTGGSSHVSFTDENICSLMEPVKKADTCHDHSAVRLLHALTPLSRSTVRSIILLMDSFIRAAGRGFRLARRRLERLQGPLVRNVESCAAAMHAVAAGGHRVPF